MFYEGQINMKTMDSRIDEFLIHLENVRMEMDIVIVSSENCQLFVNKYNQQRSLLHFYNYL